MLSYQIYKLIHLFGIFSTLVALAAICLHVIRGGTIGDNPLRRQLSALHGAGLFLALLGGFGMLARLGLSPSSGWVIAKLVIWLFFGASLTLIYRRAGSARPMLFLLPVIAILAGYFALYKPF